MFNSLSQGNALSRSAHATELWLTCAAHGITPMGLAIDELYFVRPGQTRDVHPTQARRISPLQEAAVQAVTTECAYESRAPEYIQDCLHRFKREGRMQTFRFREGTVVYEFGHLTIREKQLPQPKTRLTVCYDENKFFQWRNRSLCTIPPIPDGFREAYRRWLTSPQPSRQAFTEKQFVMWWQWMTNLESKLHNVFGACCETIRWVTAQPYPMRDVEAICRHLHGTVMWGSTTRKSPADINATLETLGMTPIRESWAEQAACILWLASCLLQQVGLPDEVPIKII